MIDYKKIMEGVPNPKVIPAPKSKQELLEMLDKGFLKARNGGASYWTNVVFIDGTVSDYCDTFGVEWDGSTQLVYGDVNNTSLWEKIKCN